MIIGTVISFLIETNDEKFLNNRNVFLLFVLMPFLLTLIIDIAPKARYMQLKNKGCIE